MTVSIDGYKYILEKKHIEFLEYEKYIVIEKSSIQIRIDFIKVPERALLQLIKKYI